MVKPFIFPLLKRCMEIFEDYLGKTASEHDLKWKSLKSQGYRFISLSVYGDPNLYAAVLVKRGGPDWEHTRGGLNSLQDQIADYRNKGYAPTIISIAGAANNATYAVVWEKGAFAEGWIVSPFESNSNQDFFAQCEWAQTHGYYLVSPTMYGSDISDVRYAAIWARYKDTQRIRWSYIVTDDENESKRWHSAHAKNRYRVSHLAVTSFHTPYNERRRYLSVFRDDMIGRYWPVHMDPQNWIGHNLPEENYEAFRDMVKFENGPYPNGFYPTCIQGSVIGDDTRYAVIFGPNDRPYDRRWTVTGYNGDTNQYHILEPSSLTGIDEDIKNFMQHEGIRAGVLAIAKEGKIKLLHGYTWAESDAGYPTTQPDSLFRIASVSKMFTCAAIQKLYDEGLLKPTDKVFPKLGISSPAISDHKPDPRINDIEVQHLVDNLGGWLRNVPDLGDPVYAIRSIALRLKLPEQLTKMDFARYMYGQQLQFTPGGKYPDGADNYSNFGYVLLGMLVEKVTNRSFIDSVRQDVLAPINVTDVFLARTLGWDRANNEVFYDDPGLGPSAVDWPGRSYASDDLVPHPHGGAGFSTEIMDSGGGLMSTAKALVQFAFKYPVWGIGKGRVIDSRNGSMSGTSSMVYSHPNGVDYAYIFNAIPSPRVNLNRKINDFLDKTPLP